MKKDLSDILRQIRADSRYVKLKESLNTMPIYQIDEDKLLTELRSIHKTRKVRVLKPGQPGFVNELVEAALQDQSNRSRIAEMSITCLRAIRSLETGVDYLRDYLLATFTDINRFGRTKEERKNVVDIALRPFIKRLNELDILKASCDVVVQDIDKTGYTLKLVLDAHIAVTKPERF